MIAANCLDINLKFQGDGLDEIGIDQDTGKTIILLTKTFIGQQMLILLGDATKLEKVKLDTSN